MKDTAIIFCGPTLPVSAIEEKLGAELDQHNQIMIDAGRALRVMPPAAEGSILSVLPLRPKAIGIVDGYFESVPSVWHKEILYAMSSGVHVLGASSMGALRAAELSAFGMEGIGAVFRFFLDGTLEDDDEVAIAHGPAEIGYPLLSEAMVNIRRNLDDACRQSIISSNERLMLLSIAKDIHYKLRTYSRILEFATQQGMSGEQAEKFRRWLQSGRRDQKLIDALELVDALIEKLDYSVDNKKVLYCFDNTVIWEKARSVDLHHVTSDQEQYLRHA